MIFMNIAIFTDSYSPQINGVVTQIKNVLKEFNPDLVHVHTPFGIGWMGLRYARQLKTPVIGTYHTLIPEFLMYLPIPFIKKSGFAKKVAWKYTNGFYNKCDVITTPSIAMKKELEKHGFFQKPLHEKDLAKHVASHDIFVTASTIETQGLTIAESMATGIPCVGTDFLAIPDSIKEGKNGFLFAPFDFFHCAQKIEKLLKNPSLRKKMGKNGVEFARKFSVNSIVTETEELYAETIKSND